MHKHFKESDDDTAASHHLALHKAHEAHAAQHEEWAAKCGKAQDAIDLEKGNRLAPMPPGFSTVTPDAPRGNVRMVARAGQPEIVRSNEIDPVFKGPFAIDGEESDEVFARTVNQRKSAPHDLTKITG